MRKFNKLLIIGAILLVPACNSDKGDKTAAMKSDAKDMAMTASPEFDKLIGEAQKAYDQALAMGAAWRDTKKIISKARAAAKSNDVSKATELAQQALAQSQMAQEQSKEQKNAGPYLF
jgi:hypothetical protein